LTSAVSGLAFAEMLDVPQRLTFPGYFPLEAHSVWN
jgi:hypothetical protein